ncbi:RNA polymerase sigma factor [Nocardioides lianchengensis]|nr:sigma-70 family RNA polymerase sigma factor [Nocardioides lianchengensis]
MLRPSARRGTRSPDAGPTDPMTSVAERDRALLAAARAGDPGAVEELYRLHLSVARGIAHGLCRPDDVDDVVAEAFTRVLDQIQQGRGPRVSFRAYLITAVRSCAADLARRDARLIWTDDVEAELEPADRTPGDSLPDSPVRQESRLLAAAIDDLPARWQLVLWWTTVEQRSLREVGTRLGISANAAAALAFRAREGLRDAYFRLHVPATGDDACTACRAALVAAARSRDATPAHTAPHLSTCGPCRDVAAELGVIRTALTAVTATLG